MSSEQLRSIFHVESQDLVPHYEVIHLTHHGTTEHSISKRSIASASSSDSAASASLPLTQTNLFDDAKTQQKFNSHHVKKDLSKSAYYSELKKASIAYSNTLSSALSKNSLPPSVSVTSTTPTTTTTTNNISDDLNHSSSFSNNSNYNKSQLVKNSLSDSKIQNRQNGGDAAPSFDMNEEENESRLPFDSQQQESNVHKFDENIDDVIVTDDISTTKMPPNVRDNADEDDDAADVPNKHIDLGNIKEHNVSINVFGEIFNLTLRPTTQLFKNGPQSLKMFTVNSSPNATHGLDYEQVEDVSVI